MLSIILLSAITTKSYIQNVIKMFIIYSQIKCVIHAEYFKVAHGRRKEKPIIADLKKGFLYVRGEGRVFSIVK